MIKVLEIYVINLYLQMHILISTQAVRKYNVTILMRYQIFQGKLQDKILYEVRSINGDFYNILLPGTHHVLQNKITSIVCFSKSCQVYDISLCDVFYPFILPINTSYILECLQARTKNIYVHSKLSFFYLKFLKIKLL